MLMNLLNPFGLNSTGRSHFGVCERAARQDAGGCPYRDLPVLPKIKSIGRQ